MSELQSVMLAQRACRRFDSAAEVLDTDIEKMLDAAVHAPSAENTQPWAFVVVRNAETRAHLAEWWSESWNNGGLEFAKANGATDTLLADFEYGLTHESGFAGAPVIIVVCADHDRGNELFFASSIYPAVQNLLLSANDLGYGSCLTTGLTTFGVERVKEKLQLPDNLVPMAAVYVGRAAKKLGPPKRRPASGVTFRERYGEQW